ncbi:14-3-3 protein 10-like [Neltuma alba]|uniref:14-3-3 protein 10-like n=1 Tax=Neltuma alba TaxID=207710 RepID=UPI0010A444DA|nr:14-3-3 protein 10-like [Prosopis alba]
MATLFTKNLDDSECIYLARLAMEAGKFDQTAYFMQKLVLSSSRSPMQLNIEERNLLFVGQKSVIDSLRGSRQSFLEAQQKEREKNSASRYLVLIEKCISDAEYQLSKECNNMLELLVYRLLPGAGTTEDKVYYNMMIGDYHGYLADFKAGAKSYIAAEAAWTAYQNGQVAAIDLAATNQTKLSLALNQSAFLYDFCDKPYEASEIAKKAYEEAADELVKTLGKGPYGNSGTTVVMKLIRDNLMAWESEYPGQLHRRPWRPLFFTEPPTPNF